MRTKLGRSLATACGLAAMMALGACSDRGSDTAAEQAVRNQMPGEQSPMPTDEAAARAAAQRTGAAELSQGSGT